MSRDPLKWWGDPKNPWNQPISTTATYGAEVLCVAKIRTMSPDYTYIHMDPTLTPLSILQSKSNTDCVGGSALTPSLPISITAPADGLNPADPGHNNGAAFVDPNGLDFWEGEPYNWCTGHVHPVVPALTKNPTGLKGISPNGTRGGSKLSTLGGVIRHGDLTDPTVVYGPGSVGPRHVLAFNVYGDADMYPACPNSNPNCGLPANTIFPNGYRWPAGRHDAAGYDPSRVVDGTVPGLGQSRMHMVMGVLLAIGRGVKLAEIGLTTQPGMMLAWTLQNYGAYVVNDSTRSVHSFTVDNTADHITGKRVADEFHDKWGFTLDTGNPPSANSAWGKDCEKILALLRIVVSNTQAHPGGGPPPYLQPLAPAFT